MSHNNLVNVGDNSDDDEEEPLMRWKLPHVAGSEYDLPAYNKEEDKSRGVKLLISFIAMLFFGLGNKIFQKVQTIPMQNYPFFLNLWTTFVYIPVSFAYILPMLCVGKLQEERLVSQRTFVIMGLLDGLAGLMQVFAVTKIASGALLILLSQAAIPISMIISRILLQTRYGVSQILGACVVMVGILVVLSPSLLQNKVEDSSNGPNVGGTLVWAAVMMLSCVPMALSSVFKEKALSDIDMDAMYLNGYIAVYQFLTCIPAAFPTALVQDMSMDDMYVNIRDGFQCYSGHNSISNSTNPSHDDDCATAPLYVNIYLVFNVAYNLLMIFILKFGSANILFLALTLMVPLGNVAFAVPWVPGHQELTAFDVSGLVVIMVGLVAYRFGGDIVKLIRSIRDEGL